MFLSPPPCVCAHLITGCAAMAISEIIPALAACVRFAIHSLRAIVL
jgi:hypothetical protein